MKLLSSSLILVGFAITACSTENEPSNSGGSSDPSDPVVSYTVTNDEYEEALTLRFKNLTYKGYIAMPGQEEQETVDVRFLADGSLHQVKAGFPGQSWPELYWRYQEDGNCFFEISATDSQDVWHVAKYSTRASFVSGNYGDDAGFISFADQMLNKYNNLTFDETSNSYKGRVTIEGPGEVDAEVKFENKLLKEIILGIDYMGQHGQYRLAVSSYGSTTIDFDSIGYVDNFYVAGRNFNIVEAQYEYDPEFDEAAFLQANSASRLSFAADGSFVLDIKYTIDAPHSEKTYSGTYTFDKFEANNNLELNVTDGVQSLTLLTGTFNLDNDNFTSGAIIRLPMEDEDGHDLYLTFKVI